jgi:hypothetical protein
MTQSVVYANLKKQPSTADRWLNVIDLEVHQTQKCTTFTVNPWAVLPIKELLVKISYIEASSHNISPNKTKFDIVRDTCVRIKLANFYII